MPNSNVVNLYPVPNGTIKDRILTVNTNCNLLTGSDGAGAGIAGNTSSSFDSMTKYIVLDVQTADVRVTYDGDAATTSNGHLLFAGRSYTWSKDTAEKAQFIKNGTTNGIIQASEFTQ